MHLKAALGDVSKKLVSFVGEVRSECVFSACPHTAATLPFYMWANLLCIPHSFVFVHFVAPL
jgi:hypothetical protein